METALAPCLPVTGPPNEPVIGKASTPQGVPSPFPSPELPQVLLAVGGFALLGLAGGLGSGVVEMTIRSVPAGVLIPVGTAVLTLPALLVVHQLSQFRAAPEVLIGAVSGAFVQTGRLALALVPVVVFFAATSGLWSLVFVGSGLLLGAVAASSAARRLHATEPPRSWLGAPRFTLLVLGWQLLALLVAARLGVAAIAFVLAPLRTGGVL